MYEELPIARQKIFALEGNKSCGKHIASKSVISENSSKDLKSKVNAAQQNGFWKA